MNADFRHLTVRLWITAVVAGLICLAMLPWWQRTMGVQWLAVPVAAMLTLCFVACGWLMNQLGLWFVGRHVREAGVWEQAGMLRDAEAAFEQAAALFDSFWLSPLQRRRRTRWVTGLLARFYLAQPRLVTRARAMVRDYLQMYPDDQRVAQSWLEHLLARLNALPEDHAVAAGVAEALAGNAPVQMLLMQLFLSSERTDFEALQTYRRVWEQSPGLPDELLTTLAKLLLKESRLSDWALQVYLKAYEAGVADCLSGIAASERWLQPNALNRADLLQAEAVLAPLDADQRRSLTQSFRPPEPRPEPELQPGAAESVIARRERTAALLSNAGRFANTLRDLVRQGALHWRNLPALRRAITAGLVLTLAVMLLVTWWPSSGQQQSGGVPAADKIEPKPAIHDPFTIQVGAYLKETDARNFVNQLQTKGLDAFWTKATSASRQWYQVKVSHFKSKEQARQYGEQLKAQGLIDDFYVANYIQTRTSGTPP